jgi:hypothetical protein
MSQVVKQVARALYRPVLSRNGERFCVCFKETVMISFPALLSLRLGGVALLRLVQFGSQ